MGGDFFNRLQGLDRRPLGRKDQVKTIHRIPGLGREGLGLPGDYRSERAQAGDAVDRFHLVFSAQGAAVQGLESVEKVSAHLSDGRLNLRGLRQGPATLQWMDLSGRVLGRETQNDPDQVLTCPTFLQEGQYYLLSVQSPQGSYHFRLRR